LPFIFPFLLSQIHCDTDSIADSSPAFTLTVLSLLTALCLGDMPESTQKQICHLCQLPPADNPIKIKGFPEERFGLYEF
jgi:hypothetical protein